MYNSSRGYQLISNQSYLVPGALLSMWNYYPDNAKNIHVWEPGYSRAMYSGLVPNCQIPMPGAQDKAKFAQLLPGLRILPNTYAQDTAKFAQLTCAQETAKY